MTLSSTPIQVGWGSQWEQLASGINAYYGGGISSSQYQTVVNYLNSGEYTVAEMESILGQIPEMQRTYNSAGQLTSVKYTANVAPAVNTGSSAASQINSNVAQATAGKSAAVVKDVQNITVDSQTGKATISNNVTKYNSGVAGQAKAVAGSAVAGICAASAGITAGKSISSTAYALGWNYLSFAGVDIEALNPQTWATITQDGEGGVADKLFNFIFQIDTDTGNPQPYMDENALAYMMAYMTATGVFSSVGHTIVDTSTLYHENLPQPVPSAGTVQSIAGNDIKLYGVGSSNVKCVGIYSTDSPIPNAYSFLCSSEPFDAHYIFNGSEWTYPSHAITTKDGKTIYIDTFNYTTFRPQFSPSYNCGYSASDINDTLFADIANVLVYGAQSGGVEGIDDQPDATVFDASGISDPSDIDSVKAALQTQYPELWDNRIEYSTDGQNNFVYVPVGFPTGGTGTQPTTNGATQADTSPQIDDDGDNVTDELIKTLIEMITLSSPTMSTDTTTPVIPTGNPNPPDTGTGDTPVVVIPTGSASALWKIYNPSQTELDTFGAWLWSSNFVDQLLKVFNDPMQAIIGLHKIFVTPSTSGSGVIKVGYLSSNATANYVDEQYADVDCGTIDLTEYFGNVFDYDPYTKINLFLPFIGFVPLSVSDCMRGSLGVMYHVDVLTGSCLAEVSVTRDLHTNVLYTFSGNCAVQYPVSSGSYVGIVTGLLGMAGGIAGTIASGGALAPAMMGIGASVGQMHTSIAHSGNISSNAGAMGIKKPYVVIERPQTALPQYYDMIEGEPQNEYTTLLDCTGGFVKVKTAIYNINAERVEIDMIRALLENGVYI